VAGERYDKMRFGGESEDTRKFLFVANVAIEEMREELVMGYGRKSYNHYIGALEHYYIPFF
jgi:rubrerythrin